jgi:hypothetical protein
MKKVKTIVLMFFICLITMNVNAQLTNTKWKGIANVPMPSECLFDFKNDTVLMRYVGNDPVDLRNELGNMVTVTGKDSMVIETMTYQFTGDTLILQKVKGGSPCDNETIGKYRIAIKDKKLLISLIADDCEARVQAWPADSLIQID